MNAMPAIEFSGISKSFAGVRVLRGISFKLGAGRTLGLVGENGAGKSTLMNILGGNLLPDTGLMVLGGTPYTPQGPTDAARAGVAFIHQELNLFANLSIAENLFLSALPRLGSLPWIDRKALHDRTATLLGQVGLAIAPDTLVEQLSAGERQLVEIVRALALEARLIILDEPTTSLSVRETETLFSLLRRLQARGIALIYISHLLEHVRELCHDLVILRDGEVVAQGSIETYDTPAIISAMVGRSLTRLYPERRGTSTTAPLLEVRSLTQVHIVRDISFTVHRGEVLGIFGLMGAGRSELARILFGLDTAQHGEVRMGDRVINRGEGPRERMVRGLAFLTEDRRHEGLCLEASIADNLALVSLRQHARTPLRLLDRNTWQRAISTVRAAVRLTEKVSDAQSVQTLSGGNQQKVILGKWLLAKPEVLILDEPTRGVDVGARFELYQLILDLADRGAGVLMISSEIEELTGLCDRILVMSQGEIRGNFPRAEFSREHLLAAALPREAHA